MINPHELRIGNWVNAQLLDFSKHNFENPDYVYTPYCVWGITNIGINPEGNWDHDIDVEFEYKTLFGIPLTADILYKCGFYMQEPDDEDKGFQNLWFLKKGVVPYSIKYRFPGLVIRKEESFILGRDGPDIKYLHQLQNAYYVYTEEELNYQP